VFSPRARDVLVETPVIRSMQFFATAKIQRTKPTPMRTRSLFKMNSPLQLRQIRALTGHLTSGTNRCPEPGVDWAPTIRAQAWGRHFCRPLMTQASFNRSVDWAPTIRGSRECRPTVSPCAAPSEQAQVLGLHKEMAIAVVRHPPEFAHLSEVCDPVDLAPTSLAQGPNAPRGTSRNAPKGEKCANLCGVRTRSEALPDRSLSFSSRYLIRPYVNIHAIGPIQKARPHTRAPLGPRPKQDFAYYRSPS
jgi:hypothetical protein